MTEFKNIKIISGGQTGVDRAALDFALGHGINCGGWCPKGRLAEDGPILLRYPLDETKSSSYKVRTEKNISESNATIIIYDNKFDAGTGLTLNLCKKLGKPYLIFKLTEVYDNYSFANWMKTNNIQILNIAGPREGSALGIYKKTLLFLEKIFL